VAVLAKARWRSRRTRRVRAAGQSNVPPLSVLGRLNAIDAPASVRCAAAAAVEQPTDKTRQRHCRGDRDRVGERVDSNAPMRYAIGVTIATAQTGRDSSQPFAPRHHGCPVTQ
jgi:hypothetical protein